LSCCHEKKYIFWSMFSSCSFSKVQIRELQKKPATTRTCEHFLLEDCHGEQKNRIQPWIMEVKEKNIAMKVTMVSVVLALKKKLVYG